MSSLQQLRTTPPYDEPWKLATLINLLIGGAVNTVGTATLTASSTTTVLADNNIKPTSRIVFWPTSANAQTAAMWADKASIPIGGGTITLHHASAAHADMTFDYVVFK